jgi:UDP-N-acetylglucosamine pyrophosphorylase
MNSFSTHEDTVRHLGKHPERTLENLVTFVQAMVPKIHADTLEPIAWPDNPDLEWCPPGHGDLYPSLFASGLLEKWADDGLQYLFVSNADNLGASVDLNIMEYFAESGLSFLMEVTERTGSDVKGGHLAQGIESHRLLLRELAQCPSGDLGAFQDTGRHRYFNTNNLWIRIDDLLAALRRNEGRLPLPVVVNRKTVDPKDPASPYVLQLESAAGAAIEAFDRSGAIVVPRSRFSPVKTTSDLLAIRSDAYRETSDGRLILDESRHGVRPLIDLDERFYKRIDQFEEAFPRGVPSLLHCDSLNVAGPWRFAAGVVCEGDVRLSNPSDETREVSAGLYRDN